MQTGKARQIALVGRVSIRGGIAAIVNGGRAKQRRHGLSQTAVVAERSEHRIAAGDVNTRIVDGDGDGVNQLEEVGVIGSNVSGDDGIEYRQTCVVITN